MSKFDEPLDLGPTAIFAALTTSENIDGDPPSEIVFMPRGDHPISANTSGGGSYIGTIHVDAQAANAVIESFKKIQASGRRAWLDFSHDEKEASAWITGFRWDDSRGIIASVSWTAAGRAALLGKSYYSFSPSFEAERETGRVVGLLSGGRSCGGLVNAPAFAAMPALIAAKAAPLPAEGECLEQGTDLPGRQNFCGFIYMN
ncbi:MAG: phage protease [Opitutaceae bacterium]